MLGNPRRQALRREGPTQIALPAESPALKRATPRDRARPAAPGGLVEFQPEPGPPPLYSRTAGRAGRHRTPGPPLATRTASRHLGHVRPGSRFPEPPPRAGPRFLAILEHALR